MNNHQIGLVRESFTKVEPIADAAGELFYSRLFELDESLRSLFSSDIKPQSKRLMDVLGTAVHHLHDLDTLVPVVQKLGHRHRAYGVEPEHFETVGEALLWTLEQGLGEHYTPEVADAWSTAYSLLAGVMQEAASRSLNLEPALAAA